MGANYIGDCGGCSNMVARAIAVTNTYNGMMVLDHNLDGNGCKFVEANENATLVVNETQALMSGVGSHQVRFPCNKDGFWESSAGTIVSSVSCLIEITSSENTSPPESTSETPVTTTTTTPPPGKGSAKKATTIS
ncbi:unnamed protein product [Strongylus vulgaris]|uniref:C6 domain-containing protein n=1 Tax=Strongylus vulgaris TaxID=40348 RepID=A0A3P7L2Q3_STRVU|nr:unnamed protein product [Strongylus vulgaris]